jgi:hypothetical protein
MGKSFISKSIFFAIFNFSICHSLYGQLYKATDLIEKVLLLKVGVRSGSGFIVKNAAGYVLVTAKHVIGDRINPDDEICFPQKHGKAIIYKIKSLSGNPIKCNFKDSTDAFVMMLYPFDGKTTELFNKACFSDKQLAINYSFSPNTEVLATGYPHFELANLNPSFFLSSFASELKFIDLNHAYDLPKSCYCFTLKNPVLKGYSGGPVFINMLQKNEVIKKGDNGKTLIVGITSAYSSESGIPKITIVTPAFNIINLANN